MPSIKIDAVQEIRNLLDDYEPRTIPRELIQNADDSGATQIHFGWIPGFPDQSHPLLKSELLLILNDGSFTTKDQESIQVLSTSGKNDADSIGRFGMGMKSVFHLCEALFYAAFPAPEFREKTTLIEFLSPWHETSIHKHWYKHEINRELVYRRLESWIDLCEERWFCILIPMRRKNQLDGFDPIVNEFPEIPKFLETITTAEMSSLIPLLKSLQTVACWDWDHSRGKPCKKWELLIDTNSQRRRSVGTTTPEIAEFIEGRMYLCEGKKTNGRLAAQFCGFEKLLSDDSFIDCTSHEKWPTKQDRATARSKPIKIKPHCAVLFSTQELLEGDHNCFEMIQACFLPLASQPLDRLNCQGDRSFRITIHGSYFLDRGRTKVLDDPNSDKRIQVTWNKRLNEIGIFPLILESLDRFISHAKLTESEIEKITDWIEKSKVYQDNKQFLCTNFQWLKRIDAEHGNCAKWELITRERDYFELPELTGSNCKLIFEMLPNLKTLSKQNVYVFFRAKKLAVKRPRELDDEHISKIISPLTYECLSSDQGLRILLSLLTSPNFTKSFFTIKKSLIVLFGSYGMGPFFEHAEEFSKLMQKLPRFSYVLLHLSLGTLEMIIDGTSRKHPVDQILLPFERFPQLSLNSKMTISNAKSILDFLESDCNCTPSIKAEIALATIEQAEGSTDSKRNELGNYKLFLVRDEKGVIKGDLSWNDLRQFYDKGLLFLDESLLKSSYYKPFCEAVPDAEFWEIGTSTAVNVFETLFRDNAPVQFDQNHSIKMLSSGCALAKPIKRESLLKFMLRDLEENAASDHIRAVRYLLHGRLESFYDTSTDLFIDTDDQDQNILKNFNITFLEESGKGWSVVTSILNKLMTPEHMKILNVKGIRSGVPKNLFDGISAHYWIKKWYGAQTEDDRITFFREIEKNPDNWPILKKLSIHRTVDGELISINSGNTYVKIGQDFKATEQLKSLVTLIEPPCDYDIQQWYRKMLPLWSPELAMTLAFNHPSPSIFFKEILDLVVLLRDTSRGASIVTEKLKEFEMTRWIPTDSAPRSIREIFNMKGLDRWTEETFLSLLNEQGYSCVTQIEKDFLDHPASEIVLTTSATGESGVLGRLGKILTNYEPYYIGELFEILRENTNDLTKLTSVLGDNLNGRTPIVPLLRNLYQDYTAHSLVKHFIQPLCKRISKERVIELLNLVRECHENADRDDCKEEAEEVFNWYLRLFMNYVDHPQKHLGTIKLLSKNGTWKHPSELFWNTEEIDDDHSINEKQEKILCQMDSQTSSERPVPHEKKWKGTRMSEQQVVQFFEKFEKHTSLNKKILGAFLGLLGNEKYISDLASNYLYPESLRAFRDSLGARPLPVSGVNTPYGCARDIHDIMSEVRFIFYSNSDEIYHAKNLLGNYVKAPQTSNISTLFVGHLERLKENLSRKVSASIGLRDFDDKELEDIDVEELFMKSANLLLKNVFHWHSDRLAKVFSYDAKSQIQLDVAQRLVLSNFLNFFIRTSGRHVESLRPIMKKWRELQLRRAETAKIDSQEIQINIELREKLENDPNVQSQLLQLVKYKIENHFQYATETIVFELFQNADDASAELFDMTASSPISMPDHFHVMFDDIKLVVAHSGRPINEFKKSRAADEQAQFEGYKFDLENMLLSGHSEKEESPGKVTGKFGLGFKSIFLISQNPKILSHKLGFEIVGGSYPKHLSTLDHERLTLFLRNELNNMAGTVFEIEFEKEKKWQVAEIINKFRYNVPLMLVFSSQIKRVIINELIQPESRMIISWHQNEIAPDTGCFVGKISFPFDEKIGDFNALVFRDDSFGCILLALGPNGVRPLPEFLLTFWNLAPLGQLRSGVAINADFALDVGRAQLAHSPERHKKVTQDMGALFKVKIKELSELARSQWSNLRQTLQLAEGTEPYEFWKSFWDLLGKPMAMESFDQSLEGRLCKEIFWSPKRGMFDLYEHFNTIPSCLGDAYAYLTSIDKIQFCADGILDQDEKLFNTVSKWPYFQEYKAPSARSLVSKARLMDPLSVLTGKEFNWTRIDLTEVLRMVVGESHEVNIKKAHVISEAITMELMDQLHDKHPDECQNLLKYLKELKFLSKDQSYENTDCLLVQKQSEQDTKTMLAAFANSSNLLHPGHSDKSIDFFRICQQERSSFLPEEKASWGIHAIDDREKTAFLKYLTANSELQDYVRERRENTWLENVYESGPYKALDEKDKKYIVGFQKENAETFPTKTSHEPETTSIKPLSSGTPKKVITDIFEWWAASESYELEIFEKDLYPDGKFPQLKQDDESDSFKESEWLKMFLLSMFQTMGRITPDQNRKYLKQNQATIYELAKKQGVPTEWLKAWDDYVEKHTSNIDYYQWSLRFHGGLYIIARRLRDYIHCLISIDQRPPEAKLSMRNVFAPRSSSEFQGGGPDVPPIHNVLGIGAHFILRELYRNGVLSHEAGHPLCYVPNKVVRKFFNEAFGLNLTDDDKNEDCSLEMYKFVKNYIGSEKATFCMSFDIPFRIISKKYELQKKLLGRTLAIDK